MAHETHGVIIPVEILKNPFSKKVLKNLILSPPTQNPEADCN